MRIRVNDRQFEKLIDDLEGVPTDLIKSAGAYYKSITPIDSGNARRKTSVKGKSIHADYAYADRLDNGYSRQAPRGMSEPTIDYIDREMERLLRRL